MAQQTTKVRTVHGLITELESRSGTITSMGLAPKVADDQLEGAIFNFANQPVDLDRIARCVDDLVATGGSNAAEVETGLCLLLAARHFYGQFCELGAYAWLLKHGVKFAAQQKLPGTDVLNPNGCTIDGHLTAVDAYFDIKGMGFQAYVAEEFRRKLEGRCAGFRVTIDGSMDVAVKDIETYAFRTLPAITKEVSGGGIYKLAELGWTVRVQRPQPVVNSTTTVDPYKLAQENRYYPFKTASQFTERSPFIMIFPYAAQFNHGLFVNFANSTEIMLRSLARRAFIELSADQTAAQNHDAQVALGVSLSDASSLLSGLLFINLDAEEEAWLFLNPRAANKFTRYQVDQMFDFSPPSWLLVDDFAYDDY
jgi:hypothetical protein